MHLKNVEQDHVNICFKYLEDAHVHL